MTAVARRRTQEERSAATRGGTGAGRVEQAQRGAIGSGGCVLHGDDLSPGAMSSRSIPDRSTSWGGAPRTAAPRQRRVSSKIARIELHELDERAGDLSV